MAKNEADAKGKWHYIFSDEPETANDKGKNTTADDIVAITRAAEVVTVHKNQIIEVEVYFGWSIPHEAPAGGFIDEKKAKKMH